MDLQYFLHKKIYRGRQGGQLCSLHYREAISETKELSCDLHKVETDHCSSFCMSRNIKTRQRPVENDWRPENVLHPTHPNQGITVIDVDCEKSNQTCHSGNASDYIRERKSIFVRSYAMANVD